MQPRVDAGVHRRAGLERDHAWAALGARAQPRRAAAEEPAARPRLQEGGQPLDEARERALVRHAARDAGAPAARARRTVATRLPDRRMGRRQPLARCGAGGRTPAHGLHRLELLALADDHRGQRARERVAPRRRGRLRIARPQRRRQLRRAPLAAGGATAAAAAALARLLHGRAPPGQRVRRCARPSGTHPVEPVAQDLVHVVDAPAAVERMQAVRAGQVVDREAGRARLEARQHRPMYREAGLPVAVAHGGGLGLGGRPHRLRVYVAADALLAVAEHGGRLPRSTRGVAQRVYREEDEQRAGAELEQPARDRLDRRELQVYRHRSKLEDDNVELRRKVRKEARQHRLRRGRVERAVVQPVLRVRPRAVDVLEQSHRPPLEGPHWRLAPVQARLNHAAKLHASLVRLLQAPTVLCHGCTEHPKPQGLASVQPPQKGAIGLRLTEPHY